MRYNDNLARKYEYSASLKREPNLTFGVENAKKTQQRINAVKFVLVILFFLVGAGAILSKNVQVTEQKNKVSELTSTYNKLVHDNKKTEIEINKKIDLKTVEEIAISNYNMNRAKKSQVVYIDVEQEDYAVINDPTTSEKEDVTKGMVAYLKK